MPACCQVWGSSQDWESHRSQVNSSESKAIRADSYKQPASGNHSPGGLHRATWAVAWWGPDSIPACFFLCLWNVLDHVHLTGYPEQPVWPCICKYFVNSTALLAIYPPPRNWGHLKGKVCFILFFFIIVVKKKKKNYNANFTIITIFKSTLELC